MPHTLDVKKLAQVFDDIEANPDRLTPWEIEFFESVYAQWKSGKTLSDKQLEVLERIYLKV